ncbi:hypothetical protein [Lacrimispora sp.]|uniref:hypothetical protein n=1 Tax=Lacrimispora sp. TaxID=2719234 RepID=UPI00345F8E6D
MQKKDKGPAEQLEEFLRFVDRCKEDYRLACEEVSEVDKRLQDLLHAMEFSETRSEADKITTQLRRSRKQRRQSKDAVKRYQLIVEFFNDQNNKATLNKMRQLLGRQRKEEEYLSSKRVYKPRAGN